MNPFPFDHFSSPYPVPRHSVYATKGMVATSQPLAAQAGLDILKKGGNAIDAAIATAASLTVVEPTSNGIGGDAFAIVWKEGKLYGLNGSGRSPQSLSSKKVREAGHQEMPVYGWYPVTVPGAPALWADLSERLGRLPLKETLEPAIHYATEGYPLSPILARFWKRAFHTFKKECKESLFKPWFDLFAPYGRPPKVGEIWRSLDHAKTLKEIAETKGRSFYEGALAKKIVSFSKETGGFFIEEDLQNHQTEWVEPLNINYRGYDVWELPPNTQGIVALQALNILKNDHFSSRDCSETIHKQIEAIKLAFADGLKYITEDQKMSMDVRDLISESYGEKRRQLIKPYARIPDAGKPEQGGTVYLATADEEGNMVSFIQSNYMGFGSGLVVPGTGIALQNRGNNFSLDPYHVNCLEGGKKTLHTIIPGFLTKKDQPIGPFGVMGGFMMPQGHLQILMNMIDFKMHPQAALDAPRWQWVEDMRIEVESRVPHHLAMALEEKGHEVKIALEPNRFGRGQIIYRDPETGVLCGGTESRTDGGIACY